MNPEIKLKILSGSNVVLAECAGLKAELFVPAIVNDRIVLQRAAVTSKVDQASFLGGNRNRLTNSNTNCNYSHKISLQQEVPRANSTPMQIKSLKENIKISKSMELSTDSTNASQSLRRFPTPDVVRRAVVNNNNESIPMQPVQILKVVRLHRAYTPNMPKNLAKVVNSTTSSPQILRNLSNVSSFGTPPSLQQSNNVNSLNCQTPNQSFLSGQIKQPGSITKWRKCITPKRTYIRARKSLSKSNLAPLNLNKNGQLIESYRANPTSAIKLRTRIKRRKLVIDNGLKITPKTFKKQLTSTEDLNRSKYQLPKSRRHFYISHMTAFDLLTNSSFYPKIGKKLNTVFRQGCVNRSASTILKYQQLTKEIPSLEELKLIS